MSLPFGAEDEITKTGTDDTIFNQCSNRKLRNFDSNEFVTRNELSLAFIPGECQNNHPVQSTLKDRKPQCIMKVNPFVVHDQFVTNNQEFLGPKSYILERDHQPKYVKPPAVEDAFWSKAEWNRKMRALRSEGVAFKSGKPRYPPKISETKAKFPAKWTDPSYMYGSPLLFTERRDVFTRPSTLLHPVYDADDYHHPLFKANPYLSTYKLMHRDFEKDLYKWEHLKATVEKGYMSDDVSIKYRVRPMQDPSENSKIYLQNRQPNRDLNKEANGCLDKFANIKLFFSKAPSNGVIPPTFKPPNFLCNQSTYEGSYGKPNHSLNVLNHQKFFQVDYTQTKLAMPEVMKTPGMYKSENKIYGSGDTVSKLIGNTQVKLLGKMF